MSVIYKRTGIPVKKILEQMEWFFKQGYAPENATYALKEHWCAQFPKTLPYNVRHDMHWVLGNFVTNAAQLMVYIDDKAITHDEVLDDDEVTFIA